mmetsp:Transcript_6427/g.19447  ORF Transcript_6427/g.19447 Transcript_6427/m.19447 type:complete len:426 (+) Transcript_6427:98-1375(+)
MHEARLVDVAVPAQLLVPAGPASIARALRDLCHRVAQVDVEVAVLAVVAAPREALRLGQALEPILAPLGEPLLELVPVLVGEVAAVGVLLQHDKHGLELVVVLEHQPVLPAALEDLVPPALGVVALGDGDLEDRHGFVGVGLPLAEAVVAGHLPRREVRHASAPELPAEDGVLVVTTQEDRDTVLPDVRGQDVLQSHGLLHHPQRLCVEDDPDGHRPQVLGGADPHDHLIGREHELVALCGEEACLEGRVALQRGNHPFRLAGRHLLQKPHLLRRLLVLLVHLLRPGKASLESRVLHLALKPQLLPCLVLHLGHADDQREFLRGGVDTAAAALDGLGLGLPPGALHVDVAGEAAAQRRKLLAGNGHLHAEARQLDLHVLLLGALLQRVLERELAHGLAPLDAVHDTAGGVGLELPEAGDAHLHAL